MNDQADGVMEGLWEKIPTVAKEPDDKATTVSIMAACITGSVLILKANFIHRASGDR